MLSLPVPSKPPSAFQYKIIISKSLSIWLVVVMAVSLLMAHAQAGVIKKREIPFTTEATTMKTTAPEEVTTAAAMTTTTTTLVITHNNNDPDIAQSILSETSSTEMPLVTTPPTVTTMTGSNETLTNIPLNASKETLTNIPMNETVTVIPLQKTNDAAATEMKINPAEKTSDLMTDHMGNSREYALNEIALNETKKMVKVSEATESNPETIKDLSETIAKGAHKKTNEITEFLGKKEEETKQQTVTKVETAKINEKLEDFVKDVANRLGSTKTDQDSQELYTNSKDFKESSSKTESASAAKTTTDSMATDLKNRLGSTQIEENTQGLQKDIKDASEAEMTTEAIVSFEDQAKATTSALKDNSIETNHIMDSTQQAKVRNENISLKPIAMAETEVATNQTLNVDDTLRFNGTFVALTTTLPLGIQDGIDRESLKELTNDLPDRTTEGAQITQPQVDTNTAERARAMFMSREEGDHVITTIRPHLITSTTVSPLGNHLEQFRNSIEDMSPATPLPPGEKKAKFINDNSTNAQKLNLPSNAEVWSLAGMKPLTHEAMTNVTIETAPKHKDQETEQHLQQERYAATTTSDSIVNTNSEKLLLDWSHITMNKDLATTANYQDNYVADPVVTTTSKSSTEDRQPMATLLESEENNLSSTHHSGTITANSTILSEAAANTDNGKDDKQQQSRLEMLTSTVTAINSSNGSGNITVQPTVNTTTSIMPSSVGGTKTTTTNPDLNEINLTLNKTSETDVLVGERFHYGDEHNNNNREAEGNVLEHADVTTEATAAATAVMDDMTNSNNKNNGGYNDNNNKSATTITTTTAAMGITAIAAEEATPSSTTTTESTTTTAVTLTATSPAEKISSETMTTTLSTLETGKVNASNTTTTTTTEHFDVADNNNNRVFVKSETGDSLREKENIELFAAATTTTTEPITSYTTSSDIPDITTYKPKFLLDKNFPINIEDTTTATTTTTAANGHQIAKAEVVDQNGNEIVEQKQSINVETTTQAGATTTTTTTSSLNQSSSTAIKTHLNEQVFETATTTTETETAEKTTSSSAKDEIINNNDDNKDFQLEITTPKQKAEAITPTTTTPTTTSESSTYNVQVEQTNTTTINGSTVEQKGQSTEREFETSTTSTDLQKTPVANVDETTTTTTTAAFIKEQEKEDTTTKSSVDIYFKYPINTKGQRKQEQKEAEDEDELNTTEATKDEQYETTTINMSEQQTTTHFSTTTTSPLYPSTNINNTTTTKEEETYISLLDETTTTTTTTTPTTTTVSDVVAQTTSSSSTTPPTPSLGSPSETSTPSSSLDEVPITSKIEDVYKVIVSTSSELPETTTSVTYAKLPEIEETEEISSSYTTISANFPEDYTTPTNMLPLTSTPRTVITADIGSSVNSLPPLMGGGSSGNMYPKNTEASGETDVNVIIAITVSVIGVVALILLVAFLYLMRKRQKQTSYSQRCRPVSLDEYAIDNASVGGSMRKSSVFRSSKRTYGNLAFDDPSLRHNPLGVHELAKFSLEKLRIFEEFRDVPQITAREDEVPQGCEDKNRYANVLPLPETRVVLQRLNDDDKTEYINANYVTGPKDPPNYYIACQAPLESTIEDFWRMIWEQQSRVIIQATDLIENGVEKCAEYLPPSVTLDNHSTFGDFQITLQNREVKDKYAISTILLKNNAENVTRELTHYWYKWPETGVPAEEAPIIAMLLEARSSLISYAIEQANEDKEKSSNATLKSAEEGTVAVVNGGSSSSVSAKEGNGNANGGASNGEINGNISLVPLKKTARNQGPLTIHCSPGTGRTGTIIGCDIAIRSLETPKRIVDIPHIVYYVRRGRASAVLTKEQYEFIYKVANVYAAKISNPTTYN